MTKDEFLPIFTGTCNAFGVEFDKGKFDIYFALLKDFDKKQINDAFKSCLYFLKFFPKISEVIECIDKPLQKSTGEMWARIMKVASNGGLGWQELTDKEVILVSDIGGLRRIQNATDASLNFIFNDFSKACEKRTVPIVFDSPERKLATLGAEPESICMLIERGSDKKFLTKVDYSALMPKEEKK